MKSLFSQTKASILRVIGIVSLVIGIANSTYGQQLLFPDEPICSGDGSFSVILSSDRIIRNATWTITPASARTITSVTNTSKTSTVEVNWTAAPGTRVVIEVNFEEQSISGLNWRDKYLMQIIYLTPLPTFNSFTGPSSVILNESNAFSFDGATSALSFQWFVDGVLNTTTSTPSASIAFPTTGSHALEGRLINACNQYTSSTIPVFVCPALDVYISGGHYYCIGESLTLTANVTNPESGYTYKWLKDNVEVSNSTNPNYVVNQDGIYSVTVTTPDGCSATTGSYSVSSNGPPTAISDVKGLKMNFVNEPSLLEVIGSDDATTFTWSVTSGQSAAFRSVGPYEGKKVYVTPTEVGIYSLKVVPKKNGCEGPPFIVTYEALSTALRTEQFVKGYNLANTEGYLFLPKHSTNYKGCISQFGPVTVNVGLDMGDNYNLGSNAFTASAKVKVTTYADLPGTDQSWEFTLNIDQSAPEQFFSKTITVHPELVKFIKITVDNNATVSTIAAQKVIRLKAFYEEAEDVVSVNNLKVSPRDASQDLNHLTWEQTFSWLPPCLDVNNYLFEIMKVYDSDGIDYSKEEAWKNALKIQTESGSTSLTLAMAEGSGTYFWRVKPLGNAAGGIANPSNWSNEMPFIRSFEYKHPEEDKNWIYSRTFTEGNKLTEQITYANGLQQLTQQQTRIQGENQIVAAQTIQDYVGRNAISSLPIPVAGLTSLGYVNGLLRNGTNHDGDGDVANNRVYSAADFDGKIPDPAIDLGGYYTATNTSNNKNDGVASAEGYPFSQTVYTADGTGRVREQAGVGFMHSIKGGKTVQTFYTKATEAELVNLFGSEAPDHRSVQKVVTYDANGIASISFQTKDGKVIATALGLTGSTGSLSQVTPTPAEKTFFEEARGNERANDITVISRTPLFLTKTGSVKIDYQLNPGQIMELCGASSSDHVANFPLQGNVNDISGHNNHGTATAVTLAQDAFGDMSAYSFNGTSSYIGVNDGPDLDFGDRDFSVSFWVYKQANVANWVNSSGVSKWSSATVAGINEWGLLLSEKGTDNNPCFSIESSRVKYSAVSSEALLLNTWYHLAGVREGNELKIYINGELRGTKTLPAGVKINNAALPLYIGRFGTVYTKGIFDDVQIFSRALDAGEVKYLLQRGTICRTCDYTVSIRLFKDGDSAPTDVVAPYAIEGKECSAYQSYRPSSATVTLTGGVNYVLEKRLTLKNKNALGQQYIDLHLQAVEADYRDQINGRLQAINGYIDQYKYAQLYTYLESIGGKRSETENNQYIVPLLPPGSGGCQEYISIPVVEECPVEVVDENTCKMNGLSFEEYFKTYYQGNAEISPVVSGKLTYLYFNNQYPGAEKKIYFPEGHFDAMVANLKTDNPALTCSILWRVWAQQVKAYEAKIKFSSAGSNEAQDLSNFATVIPTEYSLLDDFLSAIDGELQSTLTETETDFCDNNRYIQKKTLYGKIHVNSVAGTATVTTRDLVNYSSEDPFNIDVRYAYRLVYFNTDVLNMKNALRFYAGITATPPALPAEPTLDHFRSLSPCNKYRLSRSTNFGDQGYNQTTQQEVDAVIQSEIGKMRVKCGEACEGRAEEFRQAIINGLFKANTNTVIEHYNVYKNGTYYLDSNPNQLSAKIYTGVLDKTANQSAYTVSECELDAMVQAMIENCRNNYCNITLTEQLKTDLDTGAPVKVYGTEEEIEKFMMPVTHDFEVQINQSCDNSWNIINGPVDASPAVAKWAKGTVDFTSFGVDKQGNAVFVTDDDLGSPYIDELIKVSPSGQVLWKKELWNRGSGIAWIVDVKVDNANNIIIAGTHATGTFDIDPSSAQQWIGFPDKGCVFIAKFSAAGDLITAKFESGELNHVGELNFDSNNNIYLSGTGSNLDVDFSSASSLVTGRFIAKYSASLEYQWSKQVSVITGISQAGMDDVGVFTNGDVVVTGGYDNSKQFVSKLDGSGNLIWTKNFAPSDNVSMRIALGKSNSIYLYGRLFGDMDADPGTAVTHLSAANTYIIKLTDNGEYLWSKRYELTPYESMLYDRKITYDATSDEMVFAGSADGEFDLDLSENEYKLSQFPYGYFVARYTADFELIKGSVHTIPGSYVDETVDEVSAVGGYTFLSGFNIGSFSETPVPAGWFVVGAGDPHCTFTPTFCFRFTNSRVTPVVVPNGLQDYTFKAEEIPCRDVAASVLRNSINQQIEQVISSRVESFKDLYYHTCGDPSMIDDKMTLAYTEGIYQYTLYYYDRAGNLVRTVPPEGVAQATPLSTEAEVAAIKAYPRPHTLVTEYQYNALGQMIREHSPDANFEFENAALYKKPDYILTDNLTWRKINVNVTGSSVIKPSVASTGWNAGAISEQSILNNGYVEWRFTGAARFRVMGLSHDNDDVLPESIDYGFYAHISGQVMIFEKGAQVGAAVGNYYPTDVFKVERIGNKIYYKMNGATVRESLVPSQGPLYVDCAISIASGSIEDIVFSNVTTGLESEKTLADIAINKAINASPYYATYIYNDKGQIRFSRNAKQKKEGTFSYTKYDELGRVIEVGESTVYYDEAALMANRNAVGRYEFPTEGRRFVTSSYFNDPYINIGGEETALPTGYLQNKNNLRNRISYTYLDKDALDNTLDDRTYTIYSYDPHGNVDWLVQTIPGIPAVAMKYDYDLISGKVTQVSYNPGKRDEFYHRYGYDANNRLSTVKTSKEGHLWETEARYTYYLHGPVKRSVIGEDQVQGIDYTYTIHGWLKGLNHQLVDKTSDPGQDAVGSSVVGRDAFGMALGYYAGDYKGTYTQFESTNASNLAAYQGKNLYNGNIATWNTGILYPAASGIAYPVTANAYTYDVLNRITGSIMHTYSNGVYTKTDSYGSTYTYKGNGNLDVVKNYRDGGLVMDNLTYAYYVGTNRLSHVLEAAGTSPVTNDVENQGLQNYKYDAIGNLVIDETQKTMISWNSYGKVERVDKFTVDAANQKVLTGANTSFIYDAAGNRVAKKRINAAGLKVTDYYVRDASGNVMATYEKTEQGGSDSETILNELYIYGSDRLGSYNHAISMDGEAGETLLESGETRLTQNATKTQYESISYLVNAGSELTLEPGFAYTAGTGGDDFTVRVGTSGATAELTSGIYTRSLNSRRYELKDHLGNIRVIVTDLKLSTLSSNDPSDYRADITGTYNYYPFGMDITGRSWFSNTKYRYGFNGKEKDDNGEFGDIQYDYGFRIYNPAIGKFLSVDPLTKEYPWYTPYQFAGNTPIESVDLDGLEEVSNKVINDVRFVELKNVNFKMVIRESTESLTAAMTKSIDAKLDNYSINTQMGEPVPGTNPDYQTATSPQPNYRSQGYNIINGKIVGGRSSPDTWYFAVSKDNVVTADKGNPAKDSYFAVGGATPLYVNGLKYGETNVWKPDTPEEVEKIAKGAVAKENQVWLLQKSNGVYSGQNDGGTGKTILGYNSSNQHWMIVSQENMMWGGMSYDQIRDKLISEGFDLILGFDGSNSSILLKNGSESYTSPITQKNNTMPSGITLTVPKKVVPKKSTKK